VIDLKTLRDNPEAVRESQRARGEDVLLVDALLSADEQRRSAVSRADQLRAEQKALGKQVGAAQGDERTVLLDKAKAWPPKSKRLRRPSQTRSLRWPRRISGFPTWSKPVRPTAAKTTMWFSNMSASQPNSISPLATTSNWASCLARLMSSAAPRCPGHVSTSLLVSVLSCNLPC